MAEDDSLVDKNAKTDWNDYNPFTWNEDNGYFLIAPGPGATDQNPHWASGLPVYGSVESLIHDLRAGEEFAAVFDFLSAGLDVAGLAIGAAGAESPGGVLGLVAQPVISWILDHVKPFRLIQDELVGNPGTVAGIAKTWTNMGTRLGQVADHYHAAAAETLQQWRGSAADAYAEHARELATCVNSLGVLCEAWALLISTVGRMVQALHDMVRDLISGLVTALLEIAVDAVSVVPPADLLMMAKDGTVVVAKAETVLLRALVKVGEGMTSAISIVGRIYAAEQEIATRVKELIELVKRGGDAAPP